MGTNFALFHAFLIAFLFVGRSSAQGDVTIEVMDPPFQLEQDTNFIVNVPVRITSGSPSGRTFTVSFATAPSTIGTSATAGLDYIATSGTLVFDDLNTERLIPVTILADSEQEDLECFIVEINPDPANQAGLVIDSDEQSAVCIVANDAPTATSPTTMPPTTMATTMTPPTTTSPPPDPPSVTPNSPLTFSVSEGVGTVQICVLAANVVSPFTITFFTSNGDAIAPGDYTSASGTLIFSSSSTGCVDIAIVDDSGVEPTECFNLNLATPAGVTNTQPVTQICILDNDGRRVGFVQESYTVQENVIGAGIGANFQVCVELENVILSASETVNVMVTFTAAGNATDGTDYIPLSNPQELVFNSANQDQDLCAPVNIMDDLVDETNETFFASLTQSGSTVMVPVPVSPSQTLVVIVDDDATPTSPPEPEMMGPSFGDDPHFAIFLPSGKLLCYTVQGEHSFVFNLISNKKMHMNAMFVPDSHREEVTWIGSLGIVVQDTHFQGSNTTRIQFKSKLNEITINDKVTLQAKNIESITFRNGKLMISEGKVTEEFRYPSVRVNLDDLKMSFIVNFTGEHLDMMWNRLEENGKSHGLIGQFFRKGVEIDVAKKLLLLPGKDPVPVMRKPVWAYMEHNVHSDQLCWVAMNPGYQGNRLIDGHYLDYVVDNILSTDFKFECKHKHLKQY